MTREEFRALKQQQNIPSREQFRSMRAEQQPVQDSQDIFDWATEKAREQLSSLGNFPQRNYQQIARRPFEEVRPELESQIETAALGSIPSSTMNTALKRILTGAAGGATKGDTIENKLESAATGAALGMAGESIPVAAGIFKAAKRRFYDPKFNPEKVIGATLKRFAENPADPNVLERTIAALESFSQFVRGSKPTTAQAGGNAGLWALDKALMNKEQAAYRDIADVQNLARVKSLKELGLTEAAKKQGELLKQEAVKSLTAAKEVGAEINVAPVEDLINTILGTGAGKQSQVSAALNKLKGLLRDPKGGLETNLDQIQGIRNEIGVMLSGKLAGEAGNVRFAAGQVGEIKNALDDAIEQSLAASGHSGLHKAFVAKYRQGAQMVSRTEALNELLQRTSATGTIPQIGMISAGQYGPVGERIPGEILSPAKFNAALKSKAWKKALKDMTPKQKIRIENLQKDLLRSVPLDIKRGSDTAQNLATDYIMQGIANEGLLKGAMAGVGNIISKTPVLGGVMNAVIPSANILENPALREGLLQAMTDPKKAAELMKSYRESGLFNLGTLPARSSLLFNANQNK